MKYKLLVDMDGVIANFQGQMKEDFGIDPSVWNEENYKKTKESIKGTDFFYRIKPFENTNYLINKLVELFGEYRICSAPLDDDEENSTQNKLKWIKDNLEVQPVECFFTKDKFIYAKEDTILIDDLLKNLEQFNEHGGVSLLAINNGTKEWADWLVETLKVLTNRDINEKSNSERLFSSKVK